jgi:hypothetical protein
MYLKTISPDVPRFTFLCEKHKIYIYQNQKHKSLLSLLNSNIYQMVDVIKVGEWGKYQVL